MSEESSEEDDESEEESRPAPRTKAKRAVNGTKKTAATTKTAPKRARKPAAGVVNGDAGAAEVQGETFKTDSAFFSEFPFLPPFPFLSFSSLSSRCLHIR